MFVRDDVKFSLIESYKLTINGCENLWTEIKLQNNKKIIFGMIYRHPTTNIKDFHKKNCLQN